MTNLEIKRKEKGITQEKMAELLEISIGCYSMYENNLRKIPIERAEKIAQILNCKIENLFLPSYFTSSEIT